MSWVAVAAFAWNHEGLGHVSRVCATVDAFRSRTQGDCQIYVEEWQRLLTEYGLTQTPLPRYAGQLLGDAWWDAGERTVEPQIGHATAKLVIEHTLPKGAVILHDVVVYRALYEVAEDRNLPQVLIARPRKDRPDIAGWVRENAPAIKTIVVPGRQLRDSEDRGVRVVEVPPILRGLLAQERMWTRDSGAMKIAVLTGGGGHPDAEPFLNAALSAIDRFAKDGDMLEVEVVLGPLFRGRIEIPQRSQARISVRPYLDPYHSPYAGSDVVICQAGYNTLTELRAAAVRGIVVPGPRTLDDQFARARETPVDHIAVADDVSTEAIAAALRRIITSTPRPVEQRTDGARCAADVLLDVALTAGPAARY